MSDLPKEEEKKEEEKIASALKNTFSEVEAPLVFKDRLLNRMLAECQAVNQRRPASWWSRPVFWIPAVAAMLVLLVAYGLITYGMQSPGGNPPTGPIMVSPGPVSPSLTPPVVISPTAQPSPESTLPPAPSPDVPTPAATPSPVPVATPSPTGPAYMVNAGILEIRVTDAPPQQNVTAIWVSISNIQINLSGLETEDDWITVVAEKSDPFDLLELKARGVSGLLGSSQITVGQYSQIRMDVEILYAMVDGQLAIVTPTLPSGKLRIVPTVPFEIKEGLKTVVTIDFDATQSLVFTGSDKINFKPVVKLLVEYP